VAEAVDFAKLHGAEAVDEALAVTAEAERFCEGDLTSILAHRSAAEVIESPGRRGERAEALLACSARPPLGGGFGALGGPICFPALEDGFMGFNGVHAQAHNPRCASREKKGSTLLWRDRGGAKRPTSIRTSCH
jgi:hypothetical protein